MGWFVEYVLKNNGSVYQLDAPDHMKRGCNATNPSCVVHNGRLLVNLRVVDYSKSFTIDGYPLSDLSFNQYYYNTRYGYHSGNVIGEFSDGVVVDQKHMCVPPGFNVYFNGLEDARLVVWNGKLYAYGTRLDKFDRGVICIYELDDEYMCTREIVVNSPTDSVCEKNWAAVEDRPFTFIHYTNPQTIVEVDPETGHANVVVSNKMYDSYEKDLRGNTNLIRYDSDTYIELVHLSDTKFDGHGRVIHYRYAFVFYNNDLEIVGMTKLFNFRQDLCEFSCGMCVYDGRLYIGFSELDATASMIEVDFDTFFNFFRDNVTDTTIDSSYFINKTNEYIESGNMRLALPYINFCLSYGFYDGDDRNLKFLIMLSHMCQWLKDFTIEELSAMKYTLEKLVGEGCYPKELHYMLSMIHRAFGDFELSRECVEMADSLKGPCRTEFLMNINPNYL